jgi:hypothetical protein
VAQLTVAVPPSIVNSPTNQTVAAGASVIFDVTSSGSSPFGYQWLFNGTNSVGTCTNVLVLDSVQPAQAGTYTVTVTNIVGAVTSAIALLTVGLPPAVVQQPTNLVVLQGQSAIFTVGACGDSPLSYQWQFNGTNINAATTSALTVATAGSTNAGNYNAVLLNPYGSTTSSVAQLTVLVAPSVIDINFSSPSSVSLSINTAVGLNYFLEAKTNLDDNVWTTLTPGLIGTGGVLDLMDTNATAPRRFYRVRAQ